MTSNPSAGVVPRLSIMMFLQFFVWGAWFATLSAAMDANGLGDFIGGAYDSAPIAAVFAPLFLGLIADRLFPSERVMGLLMLIGGVLLAAIPTVAEKGAEGGELMVWLILGHLLCYMPTLGLGNTIAFTHITNSQDFPKVRVWGTIGWIAAGLMVGFAGWSNQFEIFYAGAISSILLSVLLLSAQYSAATQGPADRCPIPADGGRLLAAERFQLPGLRSLFHTDLRATRILLRGHFHISESGRLRGFCLNHDNRADVRNHFHADDSLLLPKTRPEDDDHGWHGLLGAALLAVCLGRA